MEHLLLAPNDNSGERVAPSVGVPGPSVRERGVAVGWAPAKQHRKGGLAPTAPPVAGTPFQLYSCIPMARFPVPVLVVLLAVESSHSPFHVQLGLFGHKGDGGLVVGDMIDPNEEMMMESESVRRNLGGKRYISYGALTMTYIHLSELRGDDEDWVIRVAPNVYPCRPLASNLRLLFLPATEVRKLGDDVASILRHGFQFVDQATLRARANDVTTLSAGSCWDRLPKRDIRIFTDYSVTSTITLWGNLGELLDLTSYTQDGGPYVIVVSSVTAGGDLMESHTDDGNVPEGDKTRKRVLSPVIKNATENSGDRLSAINKDAAENRSGPVINDTPGNCSGDP
ncbi:hypothetical protein AgCh_017767 [Apium graveolens]